MATSVSMTRLSSPTPSDMTSRVGLEVGRPSLVLGLELVRARWPEEGDEGRDSEEVLEVEEVDGLFCSSSSRAGESSSSVSPMATAKQRDTISKLDKAENMITFHAFKLL